MNKEKSFRRKNIFLRIFTIVAILIILVGVYEIFQYTRSTSTKFELEQIFNSEEEADEQENGDAVKDEQEENEIAEQEDEESIIEEVESVDEIAEEEIDNIDIEEEIEEINTNSSEEQISESIEENIVEVDSNEESAETMATVKYISLKLNENYTIEPNVGTFCTYFVAESGIYTFASDAEIYVEVTDSQGYYYDYDYDGNLICYLEKNVTYYFLVYNNNSYSCNVSLTKESGLISFDKTADKSSAGAGETINFTLTAKTVHLGNYEESYAATMDFLSLSPNAYSHYLIFYDTLDDGLQVDMNTIAVKYKNRVIPEDSYIILDSTENDGSFTVIICLDCLYYSYATECDSYNNYYSYIKDWDELSNYEFKVSYSALLSEDVTPGVYYNKASAEVVYFEYYSVLGLDELNLYNAGDYYNNGYMILDDKSENIVTPITTYGIQINKYDEETSNPLAGAVFDLNDTEGNLIETLTTDENGCAKTSRTFSEESQFNLIEVVAPDGYERIKETKEIKISSNDSETDYWHMEDIANESSTVSISGNIIWVDSSYNGRPENVTIYLIADGEIIETKTVTADDDWNYSFTNLARYDAYGNEIHYFVTEYALEEYSTTYDDYDITNIHTATKTSLTIVKNWDDGNDKDGTRPLVIEVALVKNGEITSNTITLNEDNNWQGSFTELDIEEDEEEIEYSVQELSVKNYECNISGDMKSGYIISNVYEQEDALVLDTLAFTGTLSYLVPVLLALGVVSFSISLKLRLCKNKEDK